MTFSAARGALAIGSLLAILAAIPLWHAARAANKPAPSDAARQPVLVELFTSEGCSSCPPADAFLANLDRTQPIKGADLVVLSEHVDYWNSEGWQDPFSAAQFSERQSDYAQQFKLDSVYTPQMVVDGRTQLVGSDAPQAFQAIGDASKFQKIPVSLGSLRLEDGKHLLARVEIPASAFPDNIKSAKLLLALADDNDRSDVTRGENAGRNLENVAVVRSLTQLGTLQSGQPFSKDVRASLSSANPHNLRVIAFLQAPQTGRILGIAFARLPN